MDLMVLNTDLEPISVVDLYESFIWTDRYFKYGDFELYAPISESTFSVFKKDYYVQRPGSDRAMIIEDLRTNTDVEEGNRVTITGRSLESILDRRVIWGQMTFSGNFQDAIEKMLNVCIISPSNPNRKIPNFIFKRSTDPRITSLTLEAQYTGDNLYDVIASLCEERKIGFRITINANKQFVFELYVGTDRSYDQTDVPYVIFSPNFDNVISSNYTESNSSLKNVALIGGEGEGSARRYTAVGDLSGLNRREMFVDARDISSEISENITETCDFTRYPSQVFNASSKTFVTNTLFKSCMIDVRAYAGRVVRLTIPKYTNASGAISNYATIFVNSSKQYISTIKVWDKYGDTENKGSLEEYDILLPADAAYIYTSMFSSTAISQDVYYGEESDFKCSLVKLSNTEYIEQLRQRGKEYLSENTDLTAFEGQMETSIMYKFGEDFFEGDVVQMEDEYGHSSRVRVLEVITSENEEGISVYPTFKTIDEEGDETV